MKDYQELRLLSGEIEQCGLRWPARLISIPLSSVLRLQLKTSGIVPGIIAHAESGVFCDAEQQLVPCVSSLPTHLIICFIRTVSSCDNAFKCH